MRKHAAKKTKQDAIDAVAKGMDIKEVATLIGLHYDTVRRWCRMAGVIKRQRRTDRHTDYAGDIKSQSVNAVLVDGHNIQGTAREFNIPPSTLRNWCKAKELPRDANNKTVVAPVTNKKTTFLLKTDPQPRPRITITDIITTLQEYHNIEVNLRTELNEARTKYNQLMLDFQELQKKLNTVI